MPLVTAHALTKLAQYPTQSARSLQKDLVSQHHSRIGGIGGKAEKKCPRLLAIADRFARSFYLDLNIRSMLNWITESGPELERLAPGYFDWEVIRESDISKSVITWQAFKSSHPHKKCVKREEWAENDTMCSCGIGAAHFLYKYVKPIRPNG